VKLRNSSKQSANKHPDKPLWYHMPKGDWVSLHPFKTVVSEHQANNKRHTVYAVNVLKK